jgi:hypothetical protein
MYRNIIVAFFLILIIIGSCKSKDKQVVNDTDSYAIPDTILAWKINADSMILTRDITIPDSIVSVHRIVNGLNEKYAFVQLVFIRQSGDTAFVTVTDAEYLGEQMGNAGAAQWFADAVFNITSVAGIHFVSFQIPLHSHASSGVISRDNYKKWKQR